MNKSLNKIRNRIIYRFKKAFNIKNDIPKLMSQIEIDIEDRTSFDPCIRIIDYFAGTEPLTYEVGVDKNEAIRRLKARREYIRKDTQQ